MHNFVEMHWIEKCYTKRALYLEQQILKISVQLDKFFSQWYLFSKAKINRFEKTGFEVTITEILRIKLKYK